MRGERSYHIILPALALSVLGMWIYFGLDAGISGDEYVHLNHANDVLNYFLSFGKDRSALITPETNLKYYGQGFDNLTALIIRLFNVDDIFTLRHVLNIIAAWLIVLYAFALGKKFGGLWCGILAACCLLLSPRFIGHSFNNLKDIPFALAYLMSVYYTIKWIEQLPKPGNSLSIKLIMSIAFAISIRPAGLLMICYLGLFSLLWWISRQKKLSVLQVLKPFLFITLSAYFIGLLFWPYALGNPLWHPIESHLVMSDYPVIMRQLFEGQLTWSDHLPWYYILKYIGITSPLLVLCLFFFSPFLFFLPVGKEKNKCNLLILFFVSLFPLVFILIKSSNLYGGARHLLFTYPFICVLAAMVVKELISSQRKVLLKGLILFLLMSGFYIPVKFIVKNHPLQYSYFNLLVGGVDGATGQYEIDYYYASLRKGTKRLIDNIGAKTGDTIIIASNFNMDWYLKDAQFSFKTVYTPYYSRGEKDWDYGLFVPAHIYEYDQNSLHWPPHDPLFEIKVDNASVCIGVKRQSKNDYLASQAFANDEFYDVIHYANEALNVMPYNLTANMKLGKAYFNLNEYQLAIKAFEKCLYILPNYEPALIYLAQIHQKRGDYVNAERLYDEVISYNPRYMGAYELYSDLHLTQGNKNKAIKILEMGLEFKPFDRTISQKIESIINNRKL